MASAAAAVDCLCVCVYCRNGDCEAVVPGCWYALDDVLEWAKCKWTRYVTELW